MMGHKMIALVVSYLAIVSCLGLQYDQFINYTADALSGPNVSSKTNQSETENEVELFIMTLEEEETNPSGDLAAQEKVLREYIVNKYKNITSVLNRLKQEQQKQIELQHIAGRKRGISPRASRRWTKGVVPYMFTDALDEDARGEVRRTHLTYERFTCLRFVPWTKDENNVTTNTRFGLDHQNYLEHVRRGGCWSWLGNLRGKGQTISCCGSTSCLHEYGHAMGLDHEQQSSSPDLNWQIRINPEYISTMAWYRQYSMSSNSAMVGYSINSYMHYAPWAFSKNGGPAFTRLYPELKDDSGHYYLMMEVSLAHQCEDQCPNVTIKCENDGYMTLVDNKCQCRCPEGLDPDTGCTSVIKSRTSTQEWPGGSYGLPKLKTGCVSVKEISGTRTHFNNGGNTVSTPFNLEGGVNETKVEHGFCMTENSGNKDKWPGGNYCIYRKGGSCPANFKEGFVEYHVSLSDDTPNTKRGSLPDGVYNNDKTRIEFCCRDYGFQLDPLFLPNDKPFSLLKLTNRNCHMVRGMFVFEQKMTIANLRSNKTSYGGLIPVSIEGDKFTTTFCRYVPANMDGGSYHVLTKDNPTVTFSHAEGGSFVDHYWFFKAAKDEHIRLKFENFNIPKTLKKCELYGQDSVDIRYFRTGQKGFSFCGNKLDRTFQSVNNTIIVHLKTFGDSKSSFKATATITLNEDLCYNAEDRGTSYVGNVNFTRWFEPCLPWNELTHCPYHPFKYSISGSSTLLEGNSCRNPDFKTGIKPWCYTDKKYCGRNYCDPCLYGGRYDKDEDCAERAKLGLCSDPQFADTASTSCAKTCSMKLPTPPVKAKLITCPEPPGKVAGGTLLSIGIKDTYTVGSKVNYKCDTVANVIRGRVCLTSGEWSPLGYACDSCPDGYSSNTTIGLCYGYITEAVDLATAINRCKEWGGHLPRPTNEEENAIIKLHIKGKAWIPISDEEKENEWHWKSGGKLTWTNWKGNQPDNWGYGEDCGFMYDTGKWGDVACGSSLNYLCIKPFQSLDVCVDNWYKCPLMLKDNPTMCSHDEDFAAKTCRLTCGKCSYTECAVETATETTQIVTKTKGSIVTNGRFVEYSCKDGFVHDSGDAKRACEVDGVLTGKPLTCIKACPDNGFYLSSTRECFIYFSEAVDYAIAEANCVKLGGSVTMPKTKTIFDAMFKAKGNAAGSSMYIGLTDRKEEGKFVWNDGTSWYGWNRWKSGEPNNWPNKWGYGEDCVLVDIDSWKDYGCSKRLAWKNHPYVCQVPYDVPTCTVGPPGHHELISTNTSTVKRYNFVESTCEKHYKIESGDVKRECFSNGSLGGSPLNCISAICEKGWIWSPSSNLCYKYFAEAVSNDDAQKKCRSLGGALAMPKTKIDFDAVMEARGPSSESSLIGLDDKETEGTFVWNDGTPLSGWNYWQSGEPNDYWGFFFEDCTALRYASGGWNDIPCWYKYHYICETPGDVPTCQVEVPGANVEVLTKTSSVKRYNFVEYACKEGNVQESGDTRRECLTNGSLSGSLLKCVSALQQ